MKLPRWRLFPKYATLIIVVVASVLGASSAVSLVFSWREIQAHLVALQNEKAQGAASRIEQYILDIEHELGWTAFPRLDTAGDALEQRRIEYLKLQRQVPAITELVWIGTDGRERLRVSRLAMDAVGAGTDLSKDPAYLAARGGQTWFGPVQFRKGTEPYMAIARPAGGDGGVTVADVNLKFVWDVVSRIKIGAMGLAYVVDANGTLIAHPDISLVLKKTDMKALPQVAAALDRNAVQSADGHDLAGQEVLAATTPIAALNWTVFVESPRSEAFAPLYQSIVRLGLLLIGGLLLAAAASFFLARALVRPIRALQEGTARIGAGELGQRIDVQSGDELEDLAERFNHMSAELQSSYAGLERKVEERTRELSDALEQQTATAEILRVISGSITDAQPVFDTIAERAARLTGAHYGMVFRFDGRQIQVVSTHGVNPQGVETVRRLFPMPPGEGSVTAMAIRDGAVRMVPDVLELSTTSYATQDVARSTGYRSVLSVPMTNDEATIGAITVMRPEQGLFPDKSVELLKTFASQAVIAIENARLFRETQEALERQTATAEILKVISASPTEVQPVFDAIVASCRRLCGGKSVNLLLAVGSSLEVVALASDGDVTNTIRKYPLDRLSVSGDCVLDARLAIVSDREAVFETHPRTRELATAIGWRSAAFVPLLREGKAIGCIGILRAVSGSFDAKEISLAQVFADQAVIAIENVRLFNETQRSLEQQTATAEILQVITQSPTDVQPVFDTIVAAAQKMCAATSANLVTFDGELIHVAAVATANPDDAVHRHFDTYPKRPSRETANTRAILTRSIVVIPDVLEDADYKAGSTAVAAGYRSVISVPLLREGSPIGAITVARPQPGELPQRHLTLLQTFADQAVIAIQNARLFNETKEALEQQTATAEVLRVISSSVADTAPVFEKILESCSHLFESSEQGIVLLGGDRQLHLGAHRGSARERLEKMFPVPLGDGPEARALSEQRVLHYPDVLRDAPPGSRTQVIAARLGAGTFSQVFVPMRWEGQCVGYLYVTRKPPAPFSDKEIGLLKTFADQAAIAIENARLFHALEDKSRQLEAANRHKSEFLANMSHELRTPLNAIIGFSEVLTEQMFGDVNDKQMEYLLDIHSSGQHLLSLINDVLDLSKIEAGKMELDLSCFDLGLLLEHSATLVRERAQRHGLTLDLDVGEGLNEWVADARKVKQVAVNLLSNAVKFTPNGGRVSVRARHLNGVNGRAGSWAEVSVSDTGVGIAAQDQALVFEEFRQAGGDVLRKAEGTGLGLALVRRFVELHGGTVSLESQPGQGSTFRFVLPQHEVRMIQ